MRIYKRGCVTRICLRVDLVVPIKGCIIEADNFSVTASGGARDGGEASNVGTYDGWSALIWWSLLMLLSLSFARSSLSKANTSSSSLT